MINVRLLLIPLLVSLISCTTPGSVPAPAPTTGKVEAQPPAPVGVPADAPTVKTLKIGPVNAELLQHLETYPNLEVLSMSCLENLQALPDSIGSLTKLKELRIDNGNGCAMNPVLPETVGSLRSLETLVLYGAQDPGEFRDRGGVLAQRHKFPRSMSQLKNLTFLDLGRNGLNEIPLFVKDLPKLRHLGFESNALNELPGFLNTLPQGARVTLGDNCGITGNEAKKKGLQRRFSRITLNFNDGYDCSN